MATILVVDDEEPIRRFLTAVLRQHGYRVLEADCATSALAFAENDAVDLVLTDVLMPGTSGPELGRLLRRRKPSLPVLFMSGYVNQGTDLTGENLVSKPFVVEDLIARVKKFVQGQP